MLSRCYFAIAEDVKLREQAALKSDCQGKRDFKCTTLKVSAFYMAQDRCCLRSAERQKEGRTVPELCTKGPVIPVATCHLLTLR